MRSIILFSGLFLFFIIRGQSLDVQPEIKFLALGDSYTVGTSVQISDSWPYQFKNELEKTGYKFEDFSVIAQNGWTTGNLLNALNSDPPGNHFNLVSLLIGVNNQFRGGSIDTYEAEFTQLLATAIDLAGSVNNVFIISIPDYGYTPFGIRNQEYISRGIDEFNAVNKSISDIYRVKYYNITPLSRQGIEKPEYVASDGLHPSGVMYKLWVDLILDDLGLTTAVKHSPIKTATASDEFKLIITDGKLSILNRPVMNETLQISLYSVLGKLVYSGVLNSENDLSIPEPGLYFYKIYSKTKILSTDRIIVR